MGAADIALAGRNSYFGRLLNALTGVRDQDFARLKSPNPRLGGMPGGKGGSAEGATGRKNPPRPIHRKGIWHPA